jgi:hypothetical protein
MSGFFQMPPADWFFIPVPIASLCPSSGNLADHAGITAENLTGLTTCNAFHMMPPAFISHNPFAAFHPGRIAVLSPNWAFQPGQLGPPVNSTPFPGLTGGVPQALHPSLSVQSGVATTAGPTNDLSSSVSSVQTAVATCNNPMHVQRAATTNVMQQDVQKADKSKTLTVAEAFIVTPPNKKAKTSFPQVKPVQEELPTLKQMEAENASILGRDNPSPWKNGVARFTTDRGAAAKVLAWVVENTSRKLSVIVTDALSLDGFHNWHAVHAGAPNDKRQLRHTFVVTRAQRRRALKAIPGLAQLIEISKAAIESLRLKDTPEKLEWLTAHILDQADVNSRFTWHQDTNEERKETGGRRDRRVLYSAIVKLNRGGCTSMQVCGEPEVYYHSPEGNGVIFRSNLHHRTEKAEPGVWKIALFFGIFI